MRIFDIPTGAAVLAATLSAGALAQTDAARQPAAASTAKAPPAEKRICRSETVTGSLVQKRKVCATAAERDAAIRSAQGAVRGMSGGGCIPGSEGC